MNNNLFENLRKRIILVIIGIVGYYFVPALVGILFRLFTHGELLISLWMYYIYTGSAFAFLIGFLYLALVKVKPSLVPKERKFRIFIGLIITSMVLLSVLIPSGLIVDDWKQGQCITKSGNFKDGKLSGTTSAGVGSELDCIQNCIVTGRVTMYEDKSCEFNGLFGFTHWEKTPKDFEIIEDNKSWND